MRPRCASHSCPRKGTTKKRTAKVRAVREVAQAATKQKKVVEAVAVVQTVEATTTQVEKGQEVSTGQEAEDIDLAEESADPETTSTQLKWSHVIEISCPRKKVKASKLAIDPIKLTEGDLYEIGETVRNVTKEALQEVMTE